MIPAPSAVIDAVRAERLHRCGVGASSAKIIRNLESAYIASNVNQSTKPGPMEMSRKIGDAFSGLRTALAKLFLGCLIAVCAAVTGCTSALEQPEFNPERWAPPTMQTEWKPAAADQRVSFDVESDVAQFRGGADSANRATNYDLPALIDLALSQNPDTRSAWEAARMAAAQWGIKRAPFYPLIGVASESGYQREMDLVPKHWGVLKNWQSVDQLTLDYILEDFGRRDAAAKSAREQLIASNYQFNRGIQKTVFEVERNFYLLEAQRAGVDAARAIVSLAVTDRRGVEKRHHEGLATLPNLLLAQQREARARYDLQNAELGVSEAQADLAQAVGLRVDMMPPVTTSSALTVPPTLSNAVDDLINSAIKQRPDLASRVSSLRAKDAEIEAARAAMYPTIGLSSGYGVHAFQYRLTSGPTPQYTALGPEYDAMITLKWDAFAGFEHVNSIDEAQAVRDRERAQLRALEIDVASQVWRAYYAFETALREYQYAQTLLTASQSAYDSNFRSFNDGLATIVDLLSSERDLADAKYTMIRSRTDVLISASALAFSTGTIQPPTGP